MSVTIDTANLYESLKQLEDDQLKELAVAAGTVLEAKAAEAKKAAADEIKRIAKEAGLDVSILTGTKTTGTKQPLPPMYANPDNAEQTWSGRGARPKWFKAALEGGKSADDMKI